MKTAEEIKKGLECCLEEHACVRCPYDDCDEGWHCVVERNEDALAYIKQLEMLAKPNEQVRWERDVAIDQLKQLGVGFGEKVEAQVPKWISVKERLPEDGQKVLVCGTRKGMQVGAFSGLVHPFDAMGWWWKKKKDTRLDVTHYMPIPEAPKEG